MPNDPTRRVDPRAAQLPPLVAAHRAADAYYRADDPRDQQAAEAARAMFDAIGRMALPDQVTAARQRVIAAVSSLRYSGAVYTGRRNALAGGPDDEAGFLNAVADWLDVYGPQLAERLDEAGRDIRDYGRLRDDVAAVRRVFGVEVEQ